MIQIRAIRKEMGLSQRELAQKIGSSQKSIDLWEKEKSEPTAKFICALADCFGCSTDYLLGREDDFGNVNIQSDLSEREKALLSAYRRLQEREKAQASAFLYFLLTANAKQ